MTLQANFAVEPPRIPLFNLAALFGGRSSSQPSWKYEPPTLTVPTFISPSSSDPINQGSKGPDAALASFNTPSTHAHDAGSRKVETPVAAILRADSSRKPKPTGHAEAKGDISVDRRASSTQDKIAALEKRIVAASDLDTYVALFGGWMMLTKRFEGPERLEALKRVYKRPCLADKQTPEATLRILQRLVHHGWSPADVVSWLLEAYVVLPSSATPTGSLFLQQLGHLSLSNSKAHMAESGSSLRSNLLLLYTRIASSTLEESQSLVHDASPIIYRARCVRLFHSQPKPMRRIVKPLAALLCEVARSPQRALSTRTAQKFIDYLSRLTKSSHTTPSLLQEVLELLPETIRARAQTTQAAAWQKEAFLVEDCATIEFLSSHVMFNPREALRVLEFQVILGRAFEARVLPETYVEAAKDMPKEEQARLVHVIAHKYSIAGDRTHRQNWRNVNYLCNHLMRYGLPIKPMLSQALVQTGLYAPLSQNIHIGEARKDWVFSVVRYAEGERAAHKVQQTFFRMRGALIQAAREKSLELGGPDRVYVNTVKKLGII